MLRSLSLLSLLFVLFALVAPLNASIGFGEGGSNHHKFEPYQGGPGNGNGNARSSSSRAPSSSSSAAPAAATAPLSTASRSSSATPPLSSSAPGATPPLSSSSTYIPPGGATGATTGRANSGSIFGSSSNSASGTPSGSTGSGSGSGTNSGSSSSSNSPAPDVLLRVPRLSVGRIELDVDDLQADINLSANVASLVSINAGVQVGIKKINLTIADVDAELELIVRLGHLAQIVERVFQSLDLNPLLITAINEVGQVLDNTVAAVAGLLGSITRNGSVLSFLVDSLGNIVQSVLPNGATQPLQSIVGSVSQNMTLVSTKSLQNGNLEKLYQYSPLNALVQVLTNAAGEIINTKVLNQGTSSGGSGSGSGSGGASQSTGGNGNNNGMSSSSPFVGRR